jgi:hypothetical protein
MVLSCWFLSCPGPVPVPVCAVSSRLVLAKSLRACSSSLAPRTRTSSSFTDLQYICARLRVHGIGHLTALWLVRYRWDAKPLEVRAQADPPFLRGRPRISIYVVAVFNVSTNAPIRRVLHRRVLERGVFAGGAVNSEHGRGSAERHGVALCADLVLWFLSCHCP